MNLRLPTVAGFLAAASLLSGSAFAFAPEFSNDLPTVIITDQLKNPSSVFDPNQGTTRGLFRYTNAFDMFDYISLNGNARSGVKLLFNEFPNATTSVPNDKAVGTLLINGNRAFASGSTLFPTTASDFGAGTAINAAALPTGSGQGPITFQNRDFSGDITLTGSETFDYVGDVTGWNLSTSGPQTRVVQLYLAGSPSTAVSSPKSFVAITQIGTNGDQLTAPAATSNIFTPVIASGNDFTGWVANGLGLLAIIPTSGGYSTINKWNGPGDAPATANALGTDFTDVSGFTLSPAVTIGAAAPAATTSLSAAISATKVGYVGFGRPAASTMAANKLYRLRSKLASANAASREEFRVRFGNETLVGQSSSGYVGSNASTSRPQLGTTATDFYSYLITKGTGSTNSFQIFYEVIGLGNAQTAVTATDRGQDFQVSQYELGVADYSGLTGASVLVNKGGTVTLAAGETIAPPAATPTAFALTADQTGQIPIPAENNNAIQVFDLNADQPRARVLGSGGSNFTLRINPQTGSAPSGGEVGKQWFTRIQFSPTDQASPTGVGNFPVSNGKLYVLSVYMSAPAATGTADYPQTRVSLQFANTQNEFGIYELDADAATGLTTTARAYHCVAEAQFQSFNPGASQVYGNVFIDFLSNPAEAYTATKDIVISRVSVTEFNATH
ncbi:hypothetical protein BH09SUM1_BH09SUM1_22820 [soil metagenome]